MIHLHYNHTLRVSHELARINVDVMVQMKDDFVELEKEQPLFAPSNIEPDLIKQNEPCCEQRCTEHIEFKRARQAFSTLSSDKNQFVWHGLCVTDR